jgi:hypothetical protein
MAKRARKSPKREAKSKPLKQRALAPAADEFGRALAPLGKAAGEVAGLVGDRLLSGVRNLVYAYDTVGTWLRDEIAWLLERVPKEKIVAPNPRIAVPAVQALTYSMDDAVIRTMFARLLAADMNADMKGKAHPAFVEIIKEMTPVDAKVLRTLRENGAQVEYVGQMTAGGRALELGKGVSFEIEGATPQECLRSLSNLARIGLIVVRYDSYPSSDELTKRERALLERFQSDFGARARDPTYYSPKGLLSPPTIVVVSHGLYLTALGQDFAKICIANPAAE